MCIDFDTADALLISEVKMLLEHRKAQYENQDDDHELSGVFTKTLEYCQTFSKYNSKETIQVCRCLCLVKLCACTHTHTCTGCPRDTTETEIAQV